MDEDDRRPVAEAIPGDAAAGEVGALAERPG
jgi:hypothetical protein